MVQKLRNSYIQGHIWTILSSGAWAVIGSVVTLVTTRLLGVEEAGVLSYAFSVVAVVHLLAAFGVASYHATDTGQSVPFLTYFALRCITMLLSIIIMFFFLLISEQTAYKSTVILLLFSFYLLWVGGIVFDNELQRKGKQYISGRINFSRAIFAMLLFAVAMFFTHSLVISVLAMAVAVLTVGVIGVWFTRKEFGALRQRPDVKQMRTILIACFPLFCSAFLWMLSSNMPRYVLNAYFSDEVLGTFSILAMPASLITVFASSLFNGPELTYVSLLYNNGKFEKFRKRVVRQILVITAISVLVLTAMYFGGLPLLRFVFGVDLSEYRFPFMVSVFGGCLLSLNSLFGLLLVVIRKQTWYLIGSIVSVSLALIASFLLIPQFGIIGAAWNSVVIYPITSLVYAVMLFVTLGKKLR